MVVWIIGLSGAGKSTLANAVVDELRGQGRQVVLLDGDVVREVFANDLSHDMAGRRANADRICRLGKFLESEGIDVVCSILSLFPESRAWNRSNLRRYFEVYLDTPLAHLQARDSKGLYGKFARGEISNVAGMDLPFEPPTQPDLRIDNAGSRSDLLANVRVIVDKICEEQP